MLATVLGCAVNGLAGEPVSVEVDIASGLPAFTIVGLPDAAVSEAKERVRAAIRNAGATFPPKRITVNLAPADMRKEGTGYDLPIAVGILIASGQIPATVAEGSVFLGELALTGDLRHVHGVLPVAAAVPEQDQSRLVLPAVDVAEAALIDSVTVSGFASLEWADRYGPRRGVLTALRPRRPTARAKPRDPGSRLQRCPERYIGGGAGRRRG